MVALVKDDGEVRPMTLRVSQKGLKRYTNALSEPKAPPKKLIEMMRVKKRETAKSK
jgi:uncharacterized protein (DUF1778 family)